MKVRKSISQLSDTVGLRRKLNSSITIDASTGCHEWSGSLNCEGYGQIWFHGKSWATHRVSYELYYGPIGQGDPAWWVLHKCDNPACCNPDHLFKGTPSDNARDCANKKENGLATGLYLHFTVVIKIQIKCLALFSMNINVK